MPFAKTPNFSFLQVSIISLSAEMYICRKVTEETNGSYCVALDSKHFADLLMGQVAPPPTVAATNKVSKKTRPGIHTYITG